MVYQFSEDEWADVAFFRTLGAVDDACAELDGHPGTVSWKIWGVGEDPERFDPAFHLMMRASGEILLDCYDEGGRTLGMISLGRRTKKSLRLLVESLKLPE